MTHPSPKRNMVPKALLMRSGRVSLITARPVNTDQPRTTVNSARPMTNVFNKVHSTIRRPINKNTTFKNSNFNQRVNSVKDKNVNVVRLKAVVNAVRGNQGNPQKDLQEKGVINSGCSRHMTWNMSYLTDLEEIDRGYVSFGGNPKGGKIISRALGFMRPFGCPVTILNTIDHLGKFDGKADEGFCVGYLINSKAFRTADPPFSQSSKSSLDAGFKPSGDDEKKVTKDPRKEDGDPSKEGESNDQENEDNVNSTNTVNAVSTNKVNAVGAKTSIELPDDPNMPELEDIVYSDDDEDVGAETDKNNLDAFIPVSPIPTTRVHKDHPLEQIIRDLNSAP
ncbi:hypothetical protein Tco_0127107 [Tanacetum coccineum]